MQEQRGFALGRYRWKRRLGHSRNSIVSVGRNESGFRELLKQACELQRQIALEFPRHLSLKFTARHGAHYISQVSRYMRHGAAGSSPFLEDGNRPEAVSHDDQQSNSNSEIG